MIRTAQKRRARLCPAGWALAAWLLAAPAAAPAGATKEVVLSQADGATLLLRSPAESLVTLSPHLTELVYEAGAGDLLAATVEYSDHPPQARALPRVGDAFRIDVERIHALQPDLVLAWQSGNSGSAIAHLEQLGLAVWATEIREPGGIADVLEAIGRATGREEAADEAARRLRERIDALAARYRGRTPVRYFYQVAAQPLYTINGEHLISRSLELCRGENIFAGLAGLAPQVSLESVLLADPRALIAPQIGDAADPLAQWRAWPRLTAVAEGKLLLLPADEVSRAVPRMFDAVELACEMLDDLRIR